MKYTMYIHKTKIYNTRLISIMSKPIKVVVVDIVVVVIVKIFRSKNFLIRKQSMSQKIWSMYIGVGSRDLYIDEAHKALDIFPVVFPCMLPTPLCGIFTLRYDPIGNSPRWSSNHKALWGPLMDQGWALTIYGGWLLCPLECLQNGLRSNGCSVPEKSRFSDRG